MIECSGTRTRKKEQEQEQEQFFATLCLSLNNEMQIRQKAKANTQIRMSATFECLMQIDLPASVLPFCLFFVSPMPTFCLSEFAKRL